MTFQTDGVVRRRLFDVSVPVPLIEKLPQECHRHHINPSIECSKSLSSGNLGYENNRLPYHTIHLAKAAGTANMHCELYRDKPVLVVEGNVKATLVPFKALNHNHILLRVAINE